MTLEEKIDLIGGVDGFYVRAIPALGVPRLRMADGPMGVRNFGPATAMPAGISLAATWDPALAERMGTQIGRDARAKGVHFLLGPGLDIYRAPMNGRNFEYFGEDPFLAGRIAVGYINGVQSQGVSATAKHFMGNNSEFDRHNTDSVIDERTMREIYLPAFEAAVKEAHTGAVMDAYNLVNGAHMTQNPLLNCEILKKEWGFQGVLMSDWFSTYDGVAASACLDLEMPSGAFMNRASLLPAVRDEKVSGLSYTTFQYRNLSIRPESAVISPGGTPGSGPLYEVSWDITNAGSRDGADVAEVYVGEANPRVPRPSMELKGFARVDLSAGRTQKVSVQLGRRAFSYFDPGAHEWRADPGDFTVFVGNSADQIQLKGTIVLTPAEAAAGSHQP